MIGLLLVVAFFALIALTARFGVDSRPDSNDPRRSEYPVGIN